MRLIDADAIKYKQQVMYKNGDSDDVWAEWFTTATEINNASTIDAVQVVRCQDCKWCEGYGYACVCHNPRYGDGYANYQPPHINDEYWCADGERKDDE